MINYYQMQQDFILQEGISDPDIYTYIQSISEVLESINSKSQADIRRLSIAKENLKKIKSYSRRLQQENDHLKEQIQVLEEKKE